jgi:hypothetical protein
MSWNTTSHPAAARIWPMPGVSNSTTKVPNTGARARVMAFNDRGAIRSPLFFPKPTPSGADFIRFPTD